jgi:hypothetical protein
MAKKAATPATTHHQKLLGLFPDWRLKNAVKNAGDDALANSAEACEWWGWRGAMLLMVGLIAEVILAWWDPPYASFPGRWGSACATLLVAIGVGAEVQFARMASRRTEERTRRAQDRLAAATEELARITRPRQWNALKMATMLKQFAGANVAIAVSDVTPEQFAVADELHHTFNMAGWITADWPRDPVVKRWSDTKVGTEGGLTSGILVTLGHSANQVACHALAEALTSQGVRAIALTMFDGPHKTIMVRIGDKI